MRKKSTSTTLKPGKRIPKITVKVRADDSVDGHHKSNDGEGSAHRPWQGVGGWVLGLSIVGRRWPQSIIHIWGRNGVSLPNDWVRDCMIIRSDLMRLKSRNTRKHRNVRKTFDPAKSPTARLVNEIETTMMSKWFQPSRRNSHTSVANMFRASSIEKIIVKAMSSASKTDSVVADAVQRKEKRVSACAFSRERSTFGQIYVPGICA
jgi:hypothetical protein